MPVIHSSHIIPFLKDAYTFKEVEALESFLIARGAFAFPTLKTGLFPAAIPSPDNAYTGYGNVWVRDNIQIAFAHHSWGDTASAARTVQALTDYFVKHKDRFGKIIEGRTNQEDPMQRPHVRFDGEELAELPEQWSHIQNDALGYYLWLYCLLAEAGLLASEEIQHDILQVFPSYFQAIKYWEDADSGHWEEGRKVSSSSIGAVVAGLKALRALAHKNKELIVVEHDLDALIAEGEQALSALLPWESKSPGAHERRYDAALLFLIYPLRQVNHIHAEHIVRDVTEHLQGAHGIRRYQGDSFWCANYKELFPLERRTGDFSRDMSIRDALLNEGEEAQWCLFDPILSLHYGEQYKKTGKAQDLADQTRHFNRSLCQLTDGPDNTLWLPELYYLEQGKYVANDIVPLLWAQAYLKVALQEMKESCKKVDALQ